MATGQDGGILAVNSINFQLAKQKLRARIDEIEKEFLAGGESNVSLETRLVRALAKLNDE
jgi:hypothetical protein